MPERKPWTFHCTRCAKDIPIPQGWSRGAAVRHHYWRKHSDVMVTAQEARERKEKR